MSIGTNLSNQRINITRIRKTGFFFIILLVLAAGPVKSETPGKCSDWSPANEGAFGLGTGVDNNYGQEEGFEVMVYKEQLYVGMEADNSLGARIWRTKAGITVPINQDDWEEVAADANSKPFGVDNVTQNDHIDSLVEFKGYIYASTANGGNSTFGTRIFRSSTGNPGSWEDAIGGLTPGFGDVNNTNFKDMIVFRSGGNDWLCGGTRNATTGAQVWCTTDGTSWVKKNSDGFGDPDNNLIASSGVFTDSLYLGVQNANGGSVWRTTDLLNWDKVFQSSDRPRIEVLDILNDRLYIAEGAQDGRLDGEPTIRIYSSTTGNPGSWIEVGSEIGQDPHNTRTIVDGATIYLGALYVAVMNNKTGVEIWRTDGNEWTHVTDGNEGLGDKRTFAAELISFNGHIYAWTSNYTTGQYVLRNNCPAARHVIILIGDGMGAKQIEAAKKYTSTSPIYETWTQHWVSTYSEGGSYDPDLAWTDFNYVTGGTTDSAAAASALFTGEKTTNGRISVSADGLERLFSIAEKTRSLERAVGAVTSVQISHATPGGWFSHNDARGNGYAIADEALWGDPNTTGVISDTYYGGGHGPTLPPADVIVGAGHPYWNSSRYVNQSMRDKLFTESGSPDAFTFVERIDGSEDGGSRLISASNVPTVTRLAGLFGGDGGNLEYRLADGSGHDPENPTLAEMAQAALTVSSHNSQGFILMIEGGAIDWASHANNMNRMIGEQIGFNQAVQTVVNWVEDPTNGSSWDNTLVIVTGDHETGYLSAGPGEFTNQPLGEVTTNTLTLEKVRDGSTRRASWEDTDGDNIIDFDETVYWSWNSSGHTNSLIPLFAKGAGAELFVTYATGSDPVRGAYIDNTDVFKVLDAVIFDASQQLPPIQMLFLPMVYSP